jgi:hypothetical protein
LLFYIYLSHGNEKKKKKEKRGDVVSCPQAPVIYPTENETIIYIPCDVKLKK